MEERDSSGMGLERKQQQIRGSYNERKNIQEMKNIHSR